MATEGAPLTARSDSTCCYANVDRLKNFKLHVPNCFVEGTAYFELTEAASLGPAQVHGVDCTAAPSPGQVHLGTGDPCRLHATASRACPLRSIG